MTVVCQLCGPGDDANDRWSMTVCMNNFKRSPFFCGFHDESFPFTIILLDFIVLVDSSVSSSRFKLHRSLMNALPKKMCYRFLIWWFDEIISKYRWDCVCVCVCVRCARKVYRCSYDTSTSPLLSSIIYH